MPGSKPPIIYWDSCLFIAWLKDEKRKPGEMEGLLSVAKEIHEGKKILITSVQTQTEILESKIGADYERFKGLLKRSNVMPVHVDGRIADLASKIRDHHLQMGVKIETPDATHLATAILYQATVLQTFDEDDLIPLSGNVMGHDLLIEKPSSGQLNLHLRQSKRTPMGAERIPVYYAEGSTVHHRCGNCPTGNRIQRRDLRKGDGDLPFCRECEELEKRNRCYERTYPIGEWIG